MDTNHSWLHQPLLMYYQPLFYHYSPLLMDINHDKPDMNHLLSPLEPNQIHHAHRHRLPRCCGAKVQGQPKPGRPKAPQFGWCLSHPSEKHSSMGRMTSHIYEMENKTCLKPPTRHLVSHFFSSSFGFDVTLRCHQLHGGGNPRSKKRS